MDGFLFAKRQESLDGLEGGSERGLGLVHVLRHAKLTDDAWEGGIHWFGGDYDDQSAKLR